MAKTRDWQAMRDMSARLLKARTGEGVDTWNRRIQRERFDDEEALRAWLTKQGVTGYAQSLLVMERFGYPDFLLATADELIDGQYADRPQLRPIFDAIIDAASGLGAVTIQARKTFVSLVTPRRTFARIQPTTRNRVDLSLRLEGRSPAGGSSRRRLTRPCRCRLDSPCAIRSTPRWWLGCNRPTTRTVNKALPRRSRSHQSVRTNSFPSGSAMVAFQLPHGFFSGRSVTVPPFLSIARAARLTSVTEK